MNSSLLIPIIPTLLTLLVACLIYEFTDTTKAYYQTPRKAILAWKRSSLGLTIVLRSPIQRLWLFNISIGNNPILPRYSLRFASLAIIALVFMACGNNNVTSPDTTNFTQPENAPISMEYVSDKLSTFPNCWFHNGERDTLIVEKHKYTISTRSRYRTFTELDGFGDTYAEGDVNLIDSKLFFDTKRDTVYAFNHCEGK